MEAESIDRDVTILGGGPAGLSAAFWCAELGLSAVLVEQNSELGGQLLWTYNPVTNYLGAECADGRELRDRFLSHLKDASFDTYLNERIRAVDLAAKTLTTDARVFRGKAMIIATGVRRAELGIPGEKEFRGRGILESGSKEKQLVERKTVVIVGGGDAALENAVILSDHARAVFVVHRRNSLSARKEFVREASESNNVQFLYDSRLLRIGGENRVELVEVENVRSGQTNKIEADFVLVRIGVVPNTELFTGALELDETNYIVTDASGLTSRQAVFAAGDVANPAAPTISGAVGDGATAAKAIRDLISTT